LVSQYDYVGFHLYGAFSVKFLNFVLLAAALAGCTHAATKPAALPALGHGPRVPVNQSAVSPVTSAEQLNLGRQGDDHE